MSRLKRSIVILAFGLVAIAGFAAASDAQGHYGHGGHGGVVVVGGFYAPVYPYWYDPWFAPQWGWYPPYPGPYFAPDASVKLEVKPNQAEVYVDGYYAGIVDDFDGTFQRLHVAPGQHELELYLDGYRPAKQQLYVTADKTVKVKYTLEKLGAGEQAEPRPQPPVNQGPMTVERIHSGFAAMPEVKITDFDGQVSGLIGGSAGYVAEEAFYFGGGGYWMATDRSHSRELAYGGFVMQWFLLNSDRFGVSGKVLLGGGHATTSQAVTQVVGLPSPRELGQLTQAQYNDLVRAHTVTTTIGVHQDFFVAEPEINARIALAKHLRLTFGAGYRFAGDGWWYHYYGGGHNDRVSGAVGTFGVQIGS